VLRLAIVPNPIAIAAVSAAAGSAWAIEPPIVPRERVGRCPMQRTAACNNGSRAAISGENSSVL